MGQDARVQQDFQDRVAESIYRSLGGRRRMTRKSALYKHQDFHWLEAPHLKTNRRLEQLVFGQTVGEFAIVRVIEILPVRRLPDKSRSCQDNIAQLRGTHDLVPIKRALLIPVEP